MRTRTARLTLASTAAFCALTMAVVGGAGAASATDAPTSTKHVASSGSNTKAANAVQVDAIAKWMLTSVNLKDPQDVKRWLDDEFQVSTKEAVLSAHCVGLHGSDLNGDPSWKVSYDINFDDGSECGLSRFVTFTWDSQGTRTADLDGEEAFGPAEMIDAPTLTFGQAQAAAQAYAKAKGIAIEDGPENVLLGARKFDPMALKTSYGFNFRTTSGDLVNLIVNAATGEVIQHC